MTTPLQAGEGPPVASPDDPDPSLAVVRRMFGRDTVYLALWAVQLLAAALLTPFISRVLDVTAFGQLAAANAVMQVLFVLTGLGLANALQRAFAGPDEGPEVASRLLTMLLAGSAALTVLTDVSGHLWAPALGFDGYPSALHLSVLWGGVSAATGGCLALLRSQDRLLGFATVSLAQSVVAEAAAFLLIILGPSTASRFLFGQLMAQVLALLIGLAILRPRLLRATDLRAARRAFAFGLPLIPATLGTFILTAADRLVVQDVLGQAAVARYQIAYNVGAMPILLLGVLNSTWLPRLFAVHEDATRSAVLAASRDALYRLLGPVLIGLSWGAPIVLRVWAPPSYRPDDLLLVTVLVILSAVPYAAGLGISRTMLSAGRSRAVAAMTLVAAGINLGLNVALVPRWGIEGAAVATLIAYGALQLLLARWVPGHLAVPRTRVLRGLLLACVLAAVAATAPVGTVWLVLRGVIAAGCLVWFGRVARQLATGGADQ
ncbi:MAG: oligosaccharide flippase family protein [Mycobacteriales bacterium]